MQALYAFELSGSDVNHTVNTVLQPELDPAALAFAKALFIKVLNHTEEVDVIIRRHTLNWELGRIALIDRLLMRIAIAEFLYFPDIPPKVTINECIEVAKEYSTAQSGKFVNGILDAILAELKADNQLQKTGRGLVEISPSGNKRPL